MRSRVMLTLMLTCSAPALTGCAEMAGIPVLGDVVQSLSGVTGMLAPLKDVPIVGSLVEPLLPKEEEEASNASNPSAMQVRRRIARTAAANSPEATTSADSEKVRTEAAYAALTERNRQFDRLRTWGLMQIYAGQTAGAISAFKKAQTLRPGDPQIRDLIARCEHPEMFTRDGGSGARPAIPQPNLPGGMGVPMNLPGNLPGGLPGGLPGNVQMGLPGGNAVHAGDKPGGLF